MDNYLIIILSLVTAAFFSGIEIAFLSANKFKIELENKQGKFSARILSYFVKSPSRFICTILVGINVALVIYGTYMALLLEPVIRDYLPESYQSEWIILVLQTVISTFLILVAGEFLPKVLFRINPNETLSIFSIPVIIFYVILYPVVWMVLAISHFMLKTFFRIDFVEATPAFGRIDLDHYIRNIRSKIKEDSEINTEIEMFQAALDFNKVKIRNCMIPRPEIIAMDVSETVKKLRKKFVETGLSRILIYRGDIDHIIGFVHSYEMFGRPEDIQSILLPVSVFPETMPAHDLLRHFTQEHRSVAVVVDEHGITAGMVTVEDVIEEIFGEIEDEHDVEDLVEGKISELEYVFSGRFEVDYLNEKYGIGFPAGDYETLGGLILYHHQSIPQQGEIVSAPPFIFKIQVMRGNRIEQVNVRVEKRD